MLLLQPPVTSLFGLSRPTTIAGLVISVIVNSIQRKLGRRTLSHVGKKVLKLMPSLTDSNASSAIAVEPRLVRVFAAIEHVAPSVVGGRANPSVFRVPLPLNVARETSA
jgi:hypothetical protein